MEKFKTILILIILIASGIDVRSQSMLSTMSDVNNFIEDVQFKVLLQIEIQKAESSGILSKKCFIPLGNFIDLNVLGKGKTLSISEDKLSQFLVEQSNIGSSYNDLSQNLLIEFKNNEFAQDEIIPSSKENEKPKVSLGGYFVSEFEYHQEPDGVFHKMLEINQTRIFVAADINPSAKQNQVSFLGEWNPIPEEVIHQIDSISFTRDTSLYFLSNPHYGGSSMMQMDVDNLISFERLYLKINNVAGSKINLTSGQFRIPFGFWSDYTSHRNFTSTKNNQLVNGFALKKIDLGIKLDRDYNNGLEWQLAVVQGRLSRTSGLQRTDYNDGKDFIGHLAYNHKKFAIGTSLYFADFSTHRFAAGLDYQFNFKKITISGETVYQRNNEPSEIYEMVAGIKNLSSLSSYLQFDLAVTNKMHVYGMYEVWDFMVDDMRVYHPEGKIFHGLRYNINNNLRWTILEFGYMFHKDYDKGYVHMSTQLDLTF